MTFEERSLLYKAATDPTGQIALKRFVVGVQSEQKNHPAERGQRYPRKNFFQSSHRSKGNGCFLLLAWLGSLSVISGFPCRSRSTTSKPCMNE